MNKLNSVVFSDLYPSIDLHGYGRDSARVLINDFVLENYYLYNEIIVIIHGVGTGVLKAETLNVLKKNKLVLDYKIDNFNSGMTLVLLKKKN